jgi:hypothetical protein
LTGAALHPRALDQVPDEDERGLRAGVWRLLRVEAGTRQRRPRGDEGHCRILPPVIPCCCSSDGIGKGMQERRRGRAQGRAFSCAWTRDWAAAGGRRMCSTVREVNYRSEYQQSSASCGSWCSTSICACNRSWLSVDGRRRCSALRGIDLWRAVVWGACA